MCITYLVEVKNLRVSFYFGITEYCFNVALKFKSLRIKLSLLILMILWRKARVVEIAVVMNFCS